MNREHDNQQPRYHITAVSRRTGLSTDVIRVWERRYQAISPVRGDNKRRLYSNDDVARLSMLQKLTTQGHRIGEIARLDDDQLGQLFKEAQELQSGIQHQQQGQLVDQYITACLDAVNEMDDKALDATLSQVDINFSLPVILNEIISPLMTTIGKGWSEGSLRISQEHMASTQLGHFLMNKLKLLNRNLTAPTILITTPSGQHHSMGALMASVSAASSGWNTIYLNPNLPVDEIALAAKQTHAKVIALGITLPIESTSLMSDLRQLKKLLPNTIIMVGGTGAVAFRQAFEQIKVVAINNLQEFVAKLEVLSMQSLSH